MIASLGSLRLQKNLFCMLKMFFIHLWCRKAEQTREDRDGDIEKLFQFFRECKQNNEAFYWDVDFDPKTKVLRSIFWSHASQRAEYVDFGDVITFDTTHKTNNKKMPLAMFVGCSNNLKNVSFGQALLRDETTDTFRWLFESFKSCMSGRQPFVILTGTLNSIFLIANHHMFFGLQKKKKNIYIHKKRKLILKKSMFLQMKMRQ
jgi:hypothetical protein